MFFSMISSGILAISAISTSLPGSCIKSENEQKSEGDRLADALFGDDKYANCPKEIREAAREIEEEFNPIILSFSPNLIAALEGIRLDFSNAGVDEFTNSYDANFHEALIADLNSQRVELNIFLLERLHSIDSIELLGSDIISGGAMVIGLFGGPIGFAAGTAVGALNEFAGAANNELSKRDYANLKQKMLLRFEIRRNVLGEIIHSGKDVAETTNSTDRLMFMWDHKANPHASPYAIIDLSYFCDHTDYQTDPLADAIKKLRADWGDDWLKNLKQEENEFLLGSLSQKTCEGIYETIALNPNYFARYVNLLGVPRQPDLFFFKLRP